MLPPSYIQRAQEENIVNEAQKIGTAEEGLLDWEYERRHLPCSEGAGKKPSPLTSFVSFLLSSSLKLSLSTKKCSRQVPQDSELGRKM